MKTFLLKAYIRFEAESAEHAALRLSEYFRAVSEQFGNGIAIDSGIDDPRLDLFDSAGEIELGPEEDTTQ